MRSIINQTKTLTRFPRIERKVPEFDEENIRELLAYSHRVIYQLRQNKVLIAAVIHGERTLQ